MVVRVMEANVALRLAGGVADRHGKAGGGATTSAGGGRWRGWGMMRTRRRAGIGGETETKAKGGPGEQEEVYKWLRERDQGAEGRRSEISLSPELTLAPAENWHDGIFVNTRANLAVSRQMQIALSGAPSPDTSALPRQLSNLPQI